MQKLSLSSVNQVCITSFGGTKYKLTLMWREFWCLNVSTASGEGLINGIRLSNSVDLLEQYQYIGFGGKLLCTISDDSIELYYISSDELE